MIFCSTSLPQPKNVFQKKCLCVCVSVRRRSQRLNQSTDLVQIRYLGSSSKYLKSFHFRPSLNIKGTLMFRVVHIRNKKRNIITMINCFCCYVIKSAGETAKEVLLGISHLKYTAYRNKFHLKLGYRTVNARKYVRCARIFYLINFNM